MVQVLKWLRQCPPFGSGSPPATPPVGAPIIPAPSVQSFTSGSIPANLHTASNPVAVPGRGRALSEMLPSPPSDDVFTVSRSFPDEDIISPCDSGVFMGHEPRYSITELELYKDKCEEAINRAKDELKCVICLNAERAILFSPCHHVITCGKCAQGLPFYESITGKSYRKCPICMKGVVKMTKIFLS